MNEVHEEKLRARRRQTAERIASAEWRRDPIWTSPQLRRFAAEAVWDRATYDALIAEWRFEYGLHIAAAATHIPSRARRRQGRRHRMAL